MKKNTPKVCQIRQTSRSLPISLLRAREVVMTPIREMLHGIGLTEQKWRVLRTLDECGRIEQSVIAKEACLLLPSVTRIVQSLERDGFLARLSDTADKRRMLVEITKKGRKIIRDNIKVSNQIYAELEQKMGKDKMEDLLDLLEVLQATKD